MGPTEAAARWDRDEINRWILYHGEIARALTAERTALESALIPVTAYILISGVECYRRHPEMMRAIAAARSPEELGTAGHTPGSQIDGVHLWSIANIFLVGRQILAPFGLIDPVADLDRTGTVLSFWKRAAAAFRADGHLQAWDADGVVTPYAAHVDALVEGCAPLTEALRTRMMRVNAALTTYLFLLYFDTRAGYQDTGPYPLPGGRVLLVRDFSKFGVSDFPWSTEVAADLPFSNITAAFVLEDARMRVTDFGSSVTQPEDYLARVSAFGLFTTDREHGCFTSVPDREAGELLVAVREAQRRLYRLVAAMTRREKVDAGAYVYFSFLRPFAEAAGMADDLDWTIPRDSLDVYDALASIESVPLPEPGAVVTPYYTPIPAAT